MRVGEVVMLSIMAWQDDNRCHSAIRAPADEVIRGRLTGYRKPLNLGDGIARPAAGLRGCSCDSAIDLVAACALQAENCDENSVDGSGDDAR